MKARFFRRKMDFSVLVIALALIVIGFVCLYSASTDKNHFLMKTAFGKQITWFVLGLLVLIGVLLLPIYSFHRSAYFIYGISLILLVMVFFLTSGKVHRWIGVGSLRFQPSELAKVATLLALSRHLSFEKRSVLSWRRFFGAIAFMLVPFLLILREPDVGTASVFLALFFVMIIWAGVRLKLIVFMIVPLLALICGFRTFSFIGFMIVLLTGLLVTKQKWWVVLGIGGLCFCLGLLSPTVWSKLESYQQQRILIFLGMESDPHGAAYQVIQSKVGIGSGGVLGKGFLRGSQTQLRFLPEQHTDFIFSVLGEEFGFFGVGATLGLLLCFILRILNIARTTQNRFGSFVAVGTFSIFAFQSIVNIGMTVGLAPVTGLPLPFLSYGGSSILMAMALVGLVVNVSGRRYEY